MRTYQARQFDGSWVDVTEGEYELANENFRRTLYADPPKVLDLALCESRRLVLRPGQIYRFVPMDGCEMCAQMQREHDAPPNPWPPKEPA